METQPHKKGLSALQLVVRFSWEIWENFGGSALGMCLDGDGACGGAPSLPASCLFVQILTPRTTRDPKHRDLSRCNPVTVTIIAPGAVILNLPAFLPAPILFPPLCSFPCLHGCGEHSVPLNCDFREILLDVQKQRGWGFCSLSFF